MTEATSPVSHEVTVPHRVFRRESYRVFGSPVPLRCSFRSPLRFSDSRLPHSSQWVVHPLTGFGPSSEPPIGYRPCISQFASELFDSELLPWGFSPLQRFWLSSRHIVWFHPDAAPFGLSQTLEGLVLVSPCNLISCCKRSWGFYSPRLFPASGAPWIRHPAIPSRRFPSIASVRRCVLRDSFRWQFVTRLRSIASTDGPLPSWALLPNPRCSCFPLWSCSSFDSQLIRSWPSSLEPFKLFSNAGLQRIPLRVARHLPLSWAPTAS